MLNRGKATGGTPRKGSKMLNYNTQNSHFYTSQHFLTNEQTKELIKIAEKCCIRDELMIKVAIYTGARASEILDISASHIDVADSFILIKGLKDSRDRDIAIPFELTDQLVDYIIDQDIKGLLFPIKYRRMHQIFENCRPLSWDKIGERKKGFHCLRHTFAKRELENNNNPKMLQQLLGHKSLTNTMVYLNYILDRDQQLKARKVVLL